MLVEIFCGLIFVCVVWVAAGEPDAKDAPRVIIGGAAKFVKEDIIAPFAKK